MIAEDEVLEPVRRYVTGERWKDFISCPFCFGFYVSLGIYLAWIWFPTETLFLCMPFALNVGVIALAKSFVGRD